MLKLEMEFEKSMPSESLKIGHWNEFGEYGSLDTSNSSTMSWGGPAQWSTTPEQWPTRPEQLPMRPDLSDAMGQHQRLPQTKQRSASFVDLMMSGRTINDVMAEFQMNGYDSPYNPEDDPRAEGLSSFGPAGVLLRQKSWPEPERTPVQRLPSRWSTGDVAPPMAIPDMNSNPAMISPNELITEEQRRVLSSLPSAVVHGLLRQLEQEAAGKAKPKRHDPWCRFCRNNGERESYYRSHALKDADGRVRCPVLRAFVCPRCGASGDTAHTTKYCPLATADERVKSAAMMRSVRLASGRRRAPSEELVRFGAPPAALRLDPRWAALEQKLMLW